MLDSLGHYRVLEQIGAGGMGVVYRARDERLERDVALKVLPQGALADDAARRRFRREALALSKLNHPNIATIHDFAAHEGQDVLVMEYIPGASLSDLLGRGALPAREVVRLGHQLASGLAAAHESGLVHRDLKPGNVRVMPDGRLKILDFGLVRALRPTYEGTTETAIDQPLAGTVPYMAPEQLRGEPSDHRADIYAAGAVLYEMATGTRVFADLSGAQLMGAIIQSTPRPPSARNPRVSPALERVILKALDKDPELRYQSARELAVDLERLAITTGTIPEIRMRPRRRHWLVAAVILATVILATIWIASRWRELPGVRVRERIVIADFDNRTGDSDLGQAIREGLTIQLQQSPYVNVLSRAQVFDALRRMQRLDLTILEEPIALELCLRESVAVLVTGSVYRSGAMVWIAARGIQPASREVLFTESVQFERVQDVLEHVDSLARLLRRDLGESLGGIEESSQPLAKVTTGSLEALKQYSRAADELARGNPDAAPPLLQRALELDPGFAMAHRLMARLSETLGNPGKEREHLEQAYQLRESLTERERRHVEASYFKGRGEYEKAAATLTALTSLYPDDAEARYELALAYRDLGNLRRSAQEFERAVTLNPFASAAYGDLVLVLTRLSEYNRALEVHRQAQARNIRTPRLTWGLGMVLLGQGKTEEARQEFRRLEKVGDFFASQARLYLAGTDIYEGRLGAAVDELEAGILLDRRSRNAQPERLRRYLLARVFLLRGDAQAAHVQLDSILGAGVDALGPGQLRFTGMLLARTGDRQRARVLLRELERLRDEIGSGFVRSCHDNVLGEIALAEGEQEQAAKAFLGAIAEYPRAVSTHGLARTYAAQRDWTRARGEWNKVIAARGEIFYEGFPAEWVLAHLELGRANREMGDLAAARSYYDSFLQMWQRADELPVLRQARAERRALGQ